MSNSPQYNRWLTSGLSWRLARPLADLAYVLDRYGYTVYDIGNQEHLNHQPPEDHTPFSETGWPVPSPYSYVTAIDVMPNGALPSLVGLGAQLIADKNRGVAPWIKYMNVPTNEALTRAEHVSWQPGYTIRSSSDTGHLHISCRSDMVTAPASTYDPIARLRGLAGSTLEDYMPFVAKDANTGNYYVCDLMSSRLVDAADVSDVLYLARQMGYPHGDGNNVEWTDGGITRLGWRPSAFGPLPQTSIVLTPEQVEGLRTALIDAISAAVPLTVEDVRSVVDSTVEERLNGAVIRTVGH